jgi:CDP-diacylglycerol--serine O-phosphatidyltransferase
MRHIPNFITSLNLASGFIAIIFILNGDINTASWLILAAMIFDFLDGFAARALKAYSDIGKELDSLLYATLSPDNQTVFNISGITSLIFLIIPSIMPVCAALRLAKFNIDTTQTTSFKGLPMPANALAVISIVLGGNYSGSDLLASFVASSISLIILSLSLSGLMVSRIPLLSLKFRNLRIKGNEGRYIMIVLCAVIISVFGIGSIPAIIPVYIVVSLFSLLF